MVVDPEPFSKSLFWLQTVRGIGGAYQNFFKKNIKVKGRQCPDYVLVIHKNVIDRCFSFT